MRILIAMNCCLVVLSVTLQAQPQDKDSLQPSNWDAHIRMPEAQDLNPDPNILEIELNARVATVEIEENFKVEAWTIQRAPPRSDDSIKGW